MEATSTLTRPWQHQSLPAPLLPYPLAETLVLSLLRQQSATVGAVAVGSELIRQTLTRAGISTSLLLLTGPSQVAGPDVCYQTDPAGATRFDELLGQVLSEPAPVDPGAGTWLRQRTLAAARLMATSSPSSFVCLPDVESAWHAPTTIVTQPSHLLAWLAQALPLPIAGFLALDAYIWNAGPNFSFWLLFVLPLLSAVLFGGVLFQRLRVWRRAVTLAWLARPARLRPDSERVAAHLSQAPWALLWLPPLLLLLAFASITYLLATRPRPTLGLMLGPLAVALVLQVTLAWFQGRRYLRATRTLVHGLPAGLVPSEEAQGALWQHYRFY